MIYFMSSMIFAMMMFIAGHELGRIDGEAYICKTFNAEVQNGHCVKVTREELK